MVLKRTLPKLGGIPELRTYACSLCGTPHVVEIKHPDPNRERREIPIRRRP